MTVIIQFFHFKNPNYSLAINLKYESKFLLIRLQTARIVLIIGSKTDNKKRGIFTN